MNTNIRITVADGVAEIELFRREVKNALNAATYDAVTKALLKADLDPGTRVVMIRGQEDLFCSGNDLGEFLDPQGQGTRPALALMDAVQALRKPLIAAVGGAAIGLGTTILYHSDIVYATPDARFGMPFVPLGVCPEFGTSLLAPLFSGHRLASEAVLFGETFDVHRAREMGIVNQVVENANLIPFARQRAMKLASLPSETVINAKAMLKERLYASMHGLFRQELRQFDAMLTRSETQAGIKAFLERRRAAPANN
ncbi:enoyl-CoA hydratase/isomerase family protein [Noviherbaspirillum sedimenti]|nr:enoyl-CoA hydratase-related protein [Noviherbaspirillum sedimenti]